MQARGKSSEVSEGNMKALIEKKTSKAFVPWEDVGLSERIQGRASASTLKLARGNKKNGMRSTLCSPPNGPLLSQGGRRLKTAGKSALRNLPTNTVRCVGDDRNVRTVEVVHPEYEGVPQTAVDGSAEPVSRELIAVHDVQRKRTSSGGNEDFSTHRRRFRTPPTSGEEDDSAQRRFQREPEQWAVVEEEGNENIPFRIEGALADGVQNRRLNVEDSGRQMQQITLAEETAKRRDRRQAQAMREREGVQRKKEGLPRNFLLGDEYTKKPYSVGVGDWRKELMLLSMNLDPAIGNINQQPDGAVAEIAEWIQHTWECSSPVKFEFVKEVIARGVTLRRADLWKKIRNGEPKPENVSDKSWQILERQMESPATVRKSESCSRANASRVNFGRTGPSREVGVRERLRRKFRRSPDPDEIRFEMARDKGYGGRYRKKKENTHVIHGPAGVGQLALQGYGSRQPTGNADNNIRSPHDKVADDVDVLQSPRNAESLSPRERVGEVNGSVVQALSAVEIAEHPLVMKMMERLEALEGRQNTVINRNAAEPENRTVGDAHEEKQVRKRQRSASKRQEDSGKEVAV